MNNGFESRRKRGGGSGTFNRSDLWTFNKYSVKTGNRKHIAVLSPHIMYRNLHFTGLGKMQVCESDFIDENGVSLPCSMCEQDSIKFPDQKNFPTEHLCALVCVFEDKDTMRMSKKGKEYPVNWVQVMTMPTNKEGIYTAKLEKAIDEGWLLDDIWRMEKNKENTFLAPDTLSTRDIKALGNQFDPEMHRELQREFAAKTKGEVYSLLLSAFAGIKYDNQELITMGIKPLEDDREMAAAGKDLDA